MILPKALSISHRSASGFAVCQNDLRRNRLFELLPVSWTSG